MAEKNKKEERFYTPEEVAAAVLKRTYELLKKSELFKANTSHEIEAGEEPNNEDAECPPSLEAADIESSDSSAGKMTKKGKKGLEEADKDGDGDIDGDDAIEAQEELTGEDLDGDEEKDESEEHKAKIAEKASKSKEEIADEDKDIKQKIDEATEKPEKKEKKSFEKSEKIEKEESKHDRCARKVKEKNPEVENPHAVCVSAGVEPEKWQKGELKKDIDTGAGAMITKDDNCDPKMDLKKPSLKKFLLRRKMKKSGGPTADSRMAEKLSGTAPAPAPSRTPAAEKIKDQSSPAAKVKAQPKLQMEKNKQMEKLLGMKAKAGK